MLPTFQGTDAICNIGKIVVSLLDKENRKLPNKRTIRNWKTDELEN